jgi:hypothetical protein
MQTACDLHAHSQSKLLREFTDARTITVRTIQAFSEPDLRRPAIFEGRTTTLAGLEHFLASHDCQHLAGIQWLLAKLASD